MTDYMKLTFPEVKTLLQEVKMLVENWKNMQQKVNFVSI